ncbi:hypothetical protein HMPREF0083_01857 [Aneurinibacillus aneurinilyticus ATCC 12856]|jgi:hypothetical protein|uniref:Uncharacterized protein n=1 Tax=Aneurinibacillus aneurinilyticus ATCC 12856 TaxID=649747 RepID=U1YH21_ANEAE|nr:hypothetical protein HMPREF0083_01857 [Aneurinibacillus aneurinilyticus ATCC 12856]
MSCVEAARKTEGSRQDLSSAFAAMTVTFIFIPNNCRVDGNKKESEKDTSFSLFLHKRASLSSHYYQHVCKLGRQEER